MATYVQQTLQTPIDTFRASLHGWEDRSGRPAEVYMIVSEEQPTGPAADDLGQRVTELESRLAHLEGRPIATGRTTPSERLPEVGRRDSLGDGRGTAEAHLLSMTLSLPSMLSTALIQLEELKLQRDAARRGGEETRAASLEREAAGVACASLDRALDDLPLPPAELFAEQGSIATGILDGHGDDPILSHASFTRQEVALLQLAGLGRELAERHVEAAMHNYPRATTDGDALLPTPDRVRTELEGARDAVCEALDDLRRRMDAGTAAMEKQAKRRRLIRVASFVTGGTLLTVANTLAAPVLTPLVVVMSTTLGSGAAGAVTDLFRR